MIFLSSNAALEDEIAENTEAIRVLLSTSAAIREQGLVIYDGFLVDYMKPDQVRKGRKAILKKVEILEGAAKILSEFSAIAERRIEENKGEA